MTKQNIINAVTEKLNKYPDIKFEIINSNMLRICKQDENGFDIWIETTDREHTLYFGYFHWHFDNDERETNEMLNQLSFGLTGIARIKQCSKNSQAYKWILQIKNREGNWYNNGTMGRINFNFWTKADIEYFQNNLLSCDILYNDNQ